MNISLHPVFPILACALFPVTAAGSGDLPGSSAEASASLTAPFVEKLTLPELSLAKKPINPLACSPLSSFPSPGSQPATPPPLIVPRQDVPPPLARMRIIRPAEPGSLSRMPVLRPNPDIDYKLIIRRGNMPVDYTLLTPPPDPSDYRLEMQDLDPQPVLCDTLLQQLSGLQETNHP
ncbi:hypothetical protein OPIT5_17445 [Opitutaceae bacterium TAV5]|nr:hypothetical protein OPIT5_17445 [Opitutaceae bacterium TAV5]